MKTIGVLVALSLLSTGAAASAAPLTLTITGTVSGTNDATNLAAAGLSIGDAFSYETTFDPSLFGFFGGSGGVGPWVGTADVAFSLGAFSGSETVNAQPSVLDDWMDVAPPIDGLFLFDGFTSAPLGGGFQLLGVTLTFGTTDLTTLSSFDLPTALALVPGMPFVPDLNVLTIYQPGGGPFVNIFLGDVTLTSSAVPEPMSALLLGGGLVAAAARRRRRG